MNTSTEEHEEWRPVVGWEAFYEVSNFSRVRTIERRVRNGRSGSHIRPSRIMSNHVNHKGYETVCLRANNSKEARRFVHRLALEAFVGPCPEGMEACHYDGDPHNNHLSNLRWDTKQANAADAVRLGKRPDPNRLYCSREHMMIGRNLYIDPQTGYRRCAECMRRNNRRSYATRKALL